MEGGEEENGVALCFFLASLCFFGGVMLVVVSIGSALGLKHLMEDLG